MGGYCLLLISKLTNLCASVEQVRATTYMERGDLCIAVVNKPACVVVGAVGGCRRAVKTKKRAAAAAARLLVGSERHQ